MPVTILAEATDGTITSGLETVIDVFSKCWELMLANPLIMVFVGASLIGVGVGIFRKLRRATR